MIIFKNIPLVLTVLLATLPMLKIAHAQESEVSSPEVTSAEDVLSDLADASEMADEEDEQDDQGNARPSPRRPSRLSVNSAVKVSVKKKISQDVALEVSGRIGYGGLEDPYRPRSSSASGGATISWKLGKYSFSTGFDGSNGYAEYFGRYNSNNFVVRQGVARSFAINGSWSVTPAAAVSYVFSTDTRQNRYKIDMAAPFSWKAGSLELQPILPRLSYQSYSNQDRRDWTTFLGSGFSWSATSAASLSASIGYEHRTSNSLKAQYTRWVLAPQLALKLQF
jgi:hypothetical protein